MALKKNPNLRERPISTGQLRLLHAFWERWMEPHVSDTKSSRELRHAYIEIVTQGRAHTAAELSQTDANWVIGLLSRALRLRDGSRPDSSSAGIPIGKRIRDRRLARQGLFFNQSYSVPGGLAFFAGTAGRRGYEKQRPVPVPAESLALLLRYAEAVGMTRTRLDRFIATRFRSRGLRSFSDIRTLADCNAVLWGLKSVFRRKRRSKAA